MTKLDLQKELLEKVKPGMKPSDIKKQRSNEQPQKPGLKLSPSPIKNHDGGYESDKSNQSIPIAPPLPNQDLPTQIKALQRQLQVYKDFREADLNIKEKYKQEIKEWKQKYSELEKQAKNTIKTPPEPKEPPQPKQYLFTCDICQQSKKSQLHLARVNGLGIDPHKQNKICAACLRKVDVIKEREEEFF